MPLPRRPQPRRRPPPKPATPKPTEPKESDNDKVCGRALTVGPDRPPFLGTGLTFRQFNEKYEEWLAQRYTDEITPYTRHPSSAYDPFLTEYFNAIRIELDGMTVAVSRRLSAQAARSPFMLMSVNHSWQQYTKEKREEIVLKVLEDACRRAETGEYCWSREDTPELTLEWATGFDERGFAKWIRMWENQAQTEEEKKRLVEDPDALPYHNLRNKKWDRVNGFLEVEASSTPVKKSIRAFLHDGLARRNYHLRQFIEAVFAEMVRLSSTVPSLLCSVLIFCRQPLGRTPSQIRRVCSEQRSETFGG